MLRRLYLLVGLFLDAHLLVGQPFAAGVVGPVWAALLALRPVFGLVLRGVQARLRNILDRGGRQGVQRLVGACRTDRVSALAGHEARFGRTRLGATVD